MNIMKTKASQGNRFLRIITIPVRALAKARDLYLKSMTRYADKMNYSNVMGLPHVSGLPKSFSVNSAGSFHDEDFQELVRAASARSMAVESIWTCTYAEMKIREAGSGKGHRAMPPRSSSVAMGRIDEDKPCCSFGEETSNNGNDLKYPRSKSHAVTRSTAF